MTTQYRCPTTRTDPEAESITGCGEWITASPDHEGLVDCPNCGIWFRSDGDGVETREGDPDLARTRSIMHMTLAEAQEQGLDY